MQAPVAVEVVGGDVNREEASDASYDDHTSACACARVSVVRACVCMCMCMCVCACVCV